MHIITVVIVIIIECCWLGKWKGVHPVKVLPQFFPEVCFWGLA